MTAANSIRWMQSENTAARESSSYAGAAAVSAGRLTGYAPSEPIKYAPGADGVVQMRFGVDSHSDGKILGDTTNSVDVESDTNVFLGRDRTEGSETPSRGSLQRNPAKMACPDLRKATKLIRLMPDSHKFTNSVVNMRKSCVLFFKVCSLFNNS